MIIVNKYILQTESV